MSLFLFLVLLPLATYGLSLSGVHLGWLVWFITFPLLARESQRISPLFLLPLLLVSLVLAFLHPTNALRFLVQIVGPALLCGTLLRSHRLELRDSLWLSSLSLLASIGVGFAFGMQDRLREVIIPAGFPTGALQPFVKEWEHWVRMIVPDPEILARIARFATSTEALLWSSLLYISTAIALGITLYLWDPRSLKETRSRDGVFDLSLGIFCLALGLAVVGHGFLAEIAAQAALIMLLYFFLEGVTLIFKLYTNWKVRPWLSWCSFILLFREPLFLFLLPFLGLVSGVLRRSSEEGEPA